jgi:hypothetical protein
MFTHLVLEGGGVKGIALVGAITVPEERGYQFWRVAGTSERAYRLVVMTCDISQGCLRRLPSEYGHYGLPHADRRRPRRRPSPSSTSRPD